MNTSPASMPKSIGVEYCTGKLFIGSREFAKLFDKPLEEVERIAIRLHGRLVCKKLHHAYFMFEEISTDGSKELEQGYTEEFFLLLVQELMLSRAAQRIKTLRVLAYFNEAKSFMQNPRNRLFNDESFLNNSKN